MRDQGPTKNPFQLHDEYLVELRPFHPAQPAATRGFDLYALAAPLRIEITVRVGLRIKREKIGNENLDKHARSRTGLCGDVICGGVICLSESLQLLFSR